MSKKYVIEIKPEYEDTIRGIMVLGARDSNLYMDAFAVEDMEELNSDYINEYYGDLQDDAYQRGLEDGKQIGVGAAELREKLEYQRGLKEGKKATWGLVADASSAEYQRGLDDAWNVARKIAVETDDGGVSISALYEMFGTESMCMIMKNNTVYDATDKLKAYKEKQKTDNCIEIGDEVEWDGDKYIVTYRNMDINTGVIQDYDLMMWDGSVVDHVKKCSFVKTGNHYDISSILKEMQS